MEGILYDRLITEYKICNLKEVAREDAEVQNSTRAAE